MPSNEVPMLGTAQRRATELFLQGSVVEASGLLSDAIAQRESAELWNDWAVVQLGLAERALCRALQIEASHADAGANLGVLLFSMGKRAEAAAMLKQSLARTSGPAQAHIQTLLNLCASDEGETREKDFVCCSGNAPLMQRGQKVGRPRGDQFHQTWRCMSCGYMFFDAPKQEFLAEYYQTEYPKAAASWYNADNDYEDGRCEERAQHVLCYARKYISCPHPVIHEAGCSFGGTVAKLRSLGFEATGTEPNESAIREGAKRGNRWISAEYEGDFFCRRKSEFHVIYVYHALEHMPTPLKFLKDVRGAIEKNGILIIAVPNAVNYHSLCKGFSENPWFAYPDHLHYFSPGVLPCLAQAAGYEVLEVETRMVAATQADAESLLPFKPDSCEWQLMDGVQQRALMGQELRFVLTPCGGSVAERFAAQIRNTRAICENARGQEAKMLDSCAESQRKLPIAPRDR